MPLDDNLPTYRFKPSSDNPLTSLLYYTHMGSEPSADYLLKRGSPSTSQNQYALGLFDVQYASVLYAEVLIRPDWSQPTLSAAEVRASGGTPVSVPLTPQGGFSISLYNPDQVVPVKYVSSSWSKDSWEFEMPEKSFKLPSRSRIDRDAPEPVVADLIPKVIFRWKRDSRMSRDMTCYMSGKTVGGEKNKEPDITVALFKGGKTEGSVAIYEPNLARVEVEDRKGLEVVLLLSAEIIRDLYLAPRADPFNTAGAPPPNLAGRTSPNAGATNTLQKQPAVPAGAAMSGAMGNAKPAASQPPPPQTQPLPSKSAHGPGPSGSDPKRNADIDAEKRRVQALVEQEKQKSRDRERRDREEQERIKKMLEREEREEKDRKKREVEEETERLRKQYGVDQQGRRPRSPPSPNLPPRPGPAGAVMSGGGGGWLSPTTTRPAQPPRPQSVGPPAGSSSSNYNNQDHIHQQNQQNGGASGGKKLHKFGQFLQGSPYAGPAAASVSGFFGGSNNNSKEDEKKKKARKKRSVHF